MLQSCPRAVRTAARKALDLPAELAACCRLSLNGALQNANGKSGRKRPPLSRDGITLPEQGCEESRPLHEIPETFEPPTAALARFQRFKNVKAKAEDGLDRIASQGGLATCRRPSSAEDYLRPVENDVRVGLNWATSFTFA